MPLSGTPPTDAPGQPTSPTTRTRSHLTKSSITPGTPRTYGIPQNMQPPPSRHLQKAAPKVAQPVPAPPASAPPPTPPVDPAPPFTPSPNDKSAQLAGEKPTENTAAPETVPLPEVKKAKPVQYDFRYEDSDTLMAELQEFFSYQEIHRIEDRLAAFEDLFEGEWLESSLERRKDFIRETFSGLNAYESTSQLKHAHCLTYIIEGTFKETTSPEHHLHMILENGKLVRQSGGLHILVGCLKVASEEHSALELQPDSAARRGSRAPSPELSRDVSLVNAKIGLHLEMIYFLVEGSREDDQFAEELMAFDPPLPVYCLHLLAGLKDRYLRERHHTGYPMKKLLLLTWKTILTCMGGMRDAQKAASLARELAGLPPPKDEWLGFTKASPTDILQFRRETSIKYPTFSPEQYREGTSTASAEKLAEALRPIPTRPHYHAPQREVREDDCFSSLGRLDTMYPPYAAVQPNTLNSQNGTTTTPAPSPPPSPKPKKQQWQTDQLKPFIFPFSRSAHGDQMLVPSAVQEADRLYKDHIYVSLGLHQLWKEREEFIKEDIGLGGSGILGFGVENMVVDEDEEEGEVEVARDAIMKEYREKEREFKKEECAAEKERDWKKAKKIQEKRMAWKRLERVELIYRGVLSSTLPNTVVVLLKQMLASLPPQPPAPAMNAYNNPIVSPGAPDGDSESPQDKDPKPPPTLEEIDVNREKEILSKSASAIILLLLKWFKCSHILKFQHFSQLLFEMNCPLIIVKTFLLQDSGELVRVINEDEDSNFFNYCHQKFSKHPQPSQTNASSSRPTPRRTTTRVGPTTANKHPGAPNEEEVELLSDYSWRNFFGCINRIKLIQKLLKGRTQQIHQFNQYKTFGTFKRALKVQHPMFQLQVLKIIKAQIPHYGKKWKQQNMKIVTAIYLNCRPDLRDEWLVNVLEQNELDWSTAQEAALRSLARFYHHKHYANLITPNSGGSIGSHKPTSSNANPMYFNSDPNGPPFPPDFQPHRRVSSSTGAGGDGELFPPNRSRRSSADQMPMSPMKSPEDFLNTWKHEYENVLEDVFGDGGEFGRGSPSEGNRSWGLGGGWGPLGGAISHLDLGEGWRSGDDDWSDGESSVGTIGDLGDRARLDDGESSESGESEMDDGDEGDDRTGREGGEEELVDENRNNWEHLSSQTLSAMPKSPIHHPRRRSSGGSPLRPVIKGNGVDGPELVDEDMEEENELGPAPKGPGGMVDGGIVDEVEFMYGE